MKKTCTRIFFFLLSVLIFSSCSVFQKTKLAPGEHILTHNEIDILDDGDDSPSRSDLSASVRQKPGFSFLGLGNEVIYSRRSAAQSRNAIADRLRKMGYYGSTVDTIVAYSGRNARVKYAVVPGRRIIIDSVVFRLPEDSDFSADFLADTSAMLFRKGDALSEDVIESELKRSVSALRLKGYYSLETSGYRVAIDTSSRSGRAIIYYDFDEDLHRSHIGEVSINWPEELKVRSSVLEGLNLLHPGDLYNEKIVSDTYARFSALRMFQSVGVSMSENEKGSVDSRISLTPSELQGFKTNLEASTNSSGLLGISPQFSYYHKNLFGGGEWLDLGFSGNFQFKIGEDTRATEIGTSASLNVPGIFGLDLKRIKGADIPHTRFSLAFSHQSRPEYTRNLFSASVSYSGMLTRRLSYEIYPLQLGYVKIFDLADSFSEKLSHNPYMRYSYQDHTDAGVSAGLSYSSDSRAIPTSSYWGARVQGDLSGNLISLFAPLLPEAASGEKLLFGAPFSQYARIELALTRSIRFENEHAGSLAMRFAGGIGGAYGNSSAIPYEKQFYAGGASSMRGWQTRSIGPGYSSLDHTFSIPSQTGNVKIEADLEYRFPLFWMLEGALFAEMGNVWEKADDVSFDSMAADYGLGLRFNAKLVLVRIDFGMQLRNPSLESKWLNPGEALKDRRCALHFGVGYPF